MDLVEEGTLVTFKSGEWDFCRVGDRNKIPEAKTGKGGEHSIYDSLV